MPRSNDRFSDVYKIKIRALWFKHGCLSAREAVELNIFPEDEQGKVVQEGTLRHWIHDEWVEWKDVMLARVSEESDEKVIQSRVREIERQLNRNIAISDKAFGEIMEKPFDSSAAANQAFFKANYEVRGLMQVQRVIEEMTKMETPDIQQKFRELAERANATATDVIDAEEKEET